MAERRGKKVFTTRESEWDDEQRGLVLALLDFESQTCHGCGGFLPETTDEKASYTAEAPYRCYRCTALNRQKAEYHKDFKDDETGKFDALAVWPVTERRREVPGG